MNKSSYFIVGKHPVIEALKNIDRKVIKVFLTEESKKTIHRESPNKNLLKDLKVFYKTKKELDNYCKNENILHQGFVAEIENLESIELKEFISFPLAIIVTGSNSEIRFAVSAYAALMVSIFGYLSGSRPVGHIIQVC